MFYHRKQFDGEWQIFKLKRDEVGKTEDLAVDYGLKVLRKIKQRAEAKEMKLSDAETIGMLLWTAQTLDSFGSDYVEAKALDERRKKMEAEKASKPPSS